MNFFRLLDFEGIGLFGLPKGGGLLYDPEGKPFPTPGHFAVTFHDIKTDDNAHAEPADDDFVDENGFTWHMSMTVLCDTNLNEIEHTIPVYVGTAGAGLVSFTGFCHHLYECTYGTVAFGPDDVEGRFRWRNTNPTWVASVGLNFDTDAQYSVADVWFDGHRKKLCVALWQVAMGRRFSFSGGTLYITQLGPFKGLFFYGETDLCTLPDVDTAFTVENMLPGDGSPFTPDYNMFDPTPATPRGYASLGIDGTAEVVFKCHKKPCKPGLLDATCPPNCAGCKQAYCVLIDNGVYAGHKRTYTRSPADTPASCLWVNEDTGYQLKCIKRSDDRYVWQVETDAGIYQSDIINPCGSNTSCPPVAPLRWHYISGGDPNVTITVEGVACPVETHICYVDWTISKFFEEVGIYTGWGQEDTDDGPSAPYDGPPNYSTTEWEITNLTADHCKAHRTVAIIVSNDVDCADLTEAQINASLPAYPTDGDCYCGTTRHAGCPPCPETCFDCPTTYCVTKHGGPEDGLSVEYNSPDPDSGTCNWTAENAYNISCGLDEDGNTVWLVPVGDSLFSAPATGPCLPSSGYTLVSGTGDDITVSPGPCGSMIHRQTLARAAAQRLLARQLASAPARPAATTTPCVAAAMPDHLQRVGPQLWRDLHERALATRGRIDAAAEITWLRQFGNRVPCGQCRQDWLRMMKASPPSFKSRRAYYLWTVDRHNEVNARLGKPPFVPPKRLPSRPTR